MLSYGLDNVFVFKGRKYRLNLAYDVVLRWYELQHDPWFDDAAKLGLSLRMLVKNRVRLSLRDKADLLHQIVEGYIIVPSKPSNDRQKVVDFVQDAQYIYASFLMDYGIDLVAERGRLDWRKFIALFQGLSDKTKIREIMAIRQRKIPAPTKYNAEEIRALREAKAYYALNVSAEEAEEQFQHGLDCLADNLMQRAQRG